MSDVISRNEAINIVVNYIKKEIEASSSDYVAHIGRILTSRTKIPSTVPKVWSIDKDLQANNVLMTIKGVLSPKDKKITSDTQADPKWPFFVDDMPEANWEHPCRYLLVHTDGKISEIPETAPPSAKSNLRMEELQIEPEAQNNKYAE